MRRRIKVLTVGCKANFADSAAIAGEAAAAGFEVVPPGVPADVIVVNSCTVTHRAERDSRSAARRSRRENPAATVVLTGCFAEVSPGARERLPEVDHWIRPADGKALPALLRRLSGVEPSDGRRLTEFAADLALGHRRTFLKIQDGCDFRCAYCVVPRARGRSRSVPEDEIVRRAIACEAEGAREIVLTGIHIGAYGAERGERGGLARLIARLLDATSCARFRLSSLESLEIDDALLDLVAERKRVCPHFHIPLQSGDDAVLARMRRPYRSRQYAALVERAVSRVAGVQVGADVIAGFPGESRHAFGETIRLLEDIPVHYLHVFPYSARGGTESAGWADDVPAGEKKERVRTLRELDGNKRSGFRLGQRGKTLDVLAESRGPEAGELTGYSENYLPVAFPEEGGEVGRVYPVTVVSLRAGGLLAGRRPDGRD